MATCERFFSISAKTCVEGEETRGKGRARVRGRGTEVKSKSEEDVLENGTKLCMCALADQKTNYILGFIKRRMPAV